MTTNDPENPNVSLRCEGKVYMPMTLEPNAVNFGRIKADSPTQYKVINIHAADGGLISPEVSGGREPGVNAQICEVMAGAHYELEVSLGPPWPKGKFRDVLRLKTGVDEAQNMSVIVSGYVTE